jgi:oligoribonuclease
MSALLWLDLETEGLTPEVDQILEVAWQFTDMDLDEYDEAGDTTIGVDNIHLEPFVAAMHAKSGLLEALATGPHKALHQVETEILDQIKVIGEDDVYLAGSGVHFDKAFLAAYMPRLHSRLHYRIIDVSQIDRFVRDVCGGKVLDLEPAHRAAADVRQAITRAHFLKDYISS